MEKSELPASNHERNQVWTFWALSYSIYSMGMFEKSQTKSLTPWARVKTNSHEFETMVTGSHCHVSSIRSSIL